MTMVYATLLACLLASAHGFASLPTGPRGVECSANEEKFFVYSIDPSMLYPFVSASSGPDFTTNETVTRGLVGKTWQGVHLSITQGDTAITQAGGKPLTVTSPNSLESGGFVVVSEDFCLGYGNWTVKTTAPTHPAMANYSTSDVARNLTLEERLAPGAPINTVPMKPQEIVDWALENLDVDVNNFNGNVISPFEIRWAIFPAEMRADAKAKAATGPYGMSFIEDNLLKTWAFCEVDYEKDKVVPASVDPPPLRRRLSGGGSAPRCG